MKLAINGGLRIRTEHFTAQNTIGKEEKEAVMQVMDNGILTGYQGNWSENFFGGPMIHRLETAWRRIFNVKHAIACNSATSGLFVACRAHGWLGVPKMIVTPYSMTCSATMVDGHAVFADIERDYYCLDLESIKKLYNKDEYMGAIIAVSLFGQPFNPEIVEWAKSKDIPVIEDAAQAVGSMYKDKYAGTLGDIGVYSFNLGKHLTCGEGGMMVTDNDDLALRCRLLMNHAEAVVNDMPEDKQAECRYMKGYNLRMTEMQAAIALAQLHKRDLLITKQVNNAQYLMKGLEGIPCLTMPKTRKDCTHTYYVIALKYNCGGAGGISREKFVEAVRAELAPCAGRIVEGVPIRAGYITPICDMPLYQPGEYNIPVCRDVQDRELIIIHRLFGPMAAVEELDDVIEAFHKVWQYKGELR
jgi:dTDP-4-amino-4,6-dideoxygalactose transaminase